MEYTEETKPGMADPYWYEWSVGQQYLVEMLNPDSHIQYVELQPNVQLGLDDVVITYDDGKTRFIQVKHTRADDTITFGDLVSVNKNAQHSLLSELAKSWAIEKDKYVDSEVYIFTNRKAGNRVSLAGVDKSIKRPPLDEFLLELQKKVEVAEKFSDLAFAESEKAWNEWCDQLKDIEQDDDKLLFLRNLHIETERESLVEIRTSIKDKLQTYFGVSEDVSESLLGKLDHALREWTTSVRKSPKISVEELYTALSINEDVCSYNHDLIPVNPFFASRLDLVSQIERDILCARERVFFVSGVPGTGKTNLISRLCSKKDSLIDIRYYAYEPIDPSKEYLPADVSERVKKEVFWNTVLNQLRKLLVGKLYKYRVPVSNVFLSVEEKRNEFFRIASEYAKDRNRDFVIAVDGLDHAARAGVVETTFLPTLPNPEYIPNNVKIILAGQPKEDYGDYPSWIYGDSDAVKEYAISNIHPSDIDELVNERCINFNAFNKKIVSEIICKYAEGNTLAAIFAVHEALNCLDPTTLEDKLRARNLSGNIQEYYRTIWEDTKLRMQIPFVDYKMAGVFAFFNEPISGEKLSQIFKDEGISHSSWNNILKALRPLLIENDGEYTILHNDVRVYLSGIIGRDQEHVREVYANLAEYYISLEKKSIGYYRDVIRFLISAGRTDDFSLVYTPEYILNAYVSGIELQELTNISDNLMQYVINEKVLDWNKLLSMTLGYLTIEQIQKCSYEIEGVSFRKSIKTIAVHPYECYVLSIDKWSSTVIAEVLGLVNNLYENGEENRGKNLFLSWFSDISLEEIQNIISKETDDFYLRENSDIAELLSKSCVNTEYFSIFKGIKDIEKTRFFYEIIDNLLEKVIDQYHADKLEMAMVSFELISIDSIIVGVKRLIEQNRFEDLEIIKNSLQQRDVANPMGKMILVFLKIVTSTVDWDDAQSELIWNDIDSVQMPDDKIENLMTYYSIYAVVASYLQKKSRALVARDVTEKYIEAHRHQKQNYFLLYFHALTYLGKWLKIHNEKKTFCDSIDDLKHIIENLYCKKWSPSETDFETMYLKAYVLKAYIMLSEKESEKFQIDISKSYEKVFCKNPVNQLLDSGMLYYRKRTGRMQQWVDEWLAEDGKVWAEPIGERNEIIKKFVEVKEKYDSNNTLFFHNAIDKARWSIIGFASHKEYSVDHLLNWYNVLVDRSPQFISKYGALVKDVSDKIEVLGDNRIEFVLNSKIYSDWGSVGTTQIQTILKDKRLFGQCITQPSYLIDILIGHLKTRACEKNYLLSIWALALGLLDWKNEDDHASIAAIQKAIEKCAENNGITEIKTELSQFGPAYIDLVSDPVKYIIPERWWEKVNIDREEVNNAEEILARYLSDNDEHQQHSDVVTALKTLYSKEKLDEAVLKQVMSVELERCNYGVRHNTILEFVYGIANSEDVDSSVKTYIRSAIVDNRFYPDQDLPSMIGWRLRYMDEEYNIQFLESLISMFNCWISAANHIQEPSLEEGCDYSSYVNFEREEIVEYFLEILLLLVCSEDADAARIALGGIAALLRIDINYISRIENNWNRFHYRAKEWILMVYEFVYEMCPECHERIYECLVLHSRDDDFNAALYSKLLCENIDSEFTREYSVEKKDYFSDIPITSEKLLIRTREKGPWINGYECVMEQKEILEERLEIDFEDIERRVADYSEKITMPIELIPLHRWKAGGCKVVCDKVNLSFYRVLYKDWYAGRWDGLEAEMARAIVSASEPFVLLLSPQQWKWNNGKFFDNPNVLIESTDQERTKSIEAVLSQGISDDEIVIAGIIEDYTYNKRILGFLLGYLNLPEIVGINPLHVHERNARIFLKEREDYYEYMSPNITLHQNGIESFQQSNIMCGFSEIVLQALGWSTRVCIDGVKLINQCSEVVGRLECFHGLRVDIGNRYPSNQPYMQRWVVKKDSFKNALVEAHCSFNVRTSTESIIEGNEV